MFPKYQSRQIKPRFEWHPIMNPNHPLSIGCVGLWLFNETGGLTVYDLSPFKNNGTLTNGPTWSPGRLGQALSFDGVDDNVGMGSPASLDDIDLQTGSGMTISAWIYPESSGEGSNGTIVTKSGSGGGGTGAWRFALYLTRLQCIKDYATTDLETRSINDSYILNTWQHVVLTWTGNPTSSTEVKFYVNGNLMSHISDQDGVGAKNSDAGVNLQIGSSLGGYTFDGLIDEIRIYNRALSQQEIQWLYQAPYDNLIIEPTRKFWFIPEAATGGLSINVADCVEARAIPV